MPHKELVVEPHVAGYGLVTNFLFEGLMALAGDRPMFTFGGSACSRTGFTAPSCDSTWQVPRAATPACPHTLLASNQTYAHLVPAYLHGQIDRLPKLDRLAAPMLYEPPTAIETLRSRLPDRSESREISEAHLERL